MWRLASVKEKPRKPTSPKWGRASPYFRIVGGTQVTENKYPWYCFLEISSTSGNFLCGGSLVTPDYVITAAHCLHGISINNIRVMMNCVSRINTTNAVFANCSGSNIILNKDYNPKTMNNDIAILRITYDRPEKKGTVPTILLNNGNINDSQQLEIIGFGLTQESGSTSKELMKASVKVVPDSTCDDSYVGIDFSNKICAAEAGKDSCQGDSGGPLFFGDTLYGITSFGTGCARQGFPGVYTDIYVQKNWIKSIITQDNIWKNRSDPQPTTTPTQKPAAPTQKPAAPTQVPVTPKKDNRKIIGITIGILVGLILLGGLISVLLRVDFKKMSLKIFPR